MLACFYYRLLKFREAPKEQKASEYWIIGKLVNTHIVGHLLALGAGALIVTNLIIAHPANCDPAGISRTVNQWYYGISRISF